MRRYLTIMDHLPALVFWAIAAYFASKIAVAFFPGEPVAWQMYLNIAPFWREFGVLYNTPTLALAALLVTSFYTIGAICLLLVQNRHMRRARFIYYHLALLALIYGMNDEQVWLSRNKNGGAFEYSLLPNFSQVSPVIVWLFMGVLIACLTIHYDMISRPFRRRRTPRSED
ncbi:MAG: hypothetical protein AB3N20_09340 [Rhizobiaceae bacterium]